MYTLRVTTAISAPPARCFDLARSIDAHIRSAGSSGEQAVGGRTSGLLEMGEEVTWEGKHFGIRQRLTSRITAFQPPHYFQDRMVRGAFRFLEHDHHFDDGDAGDTIMFDVVRFEAPFGPVGWLAERLLLAGHLKRFLEERGAALKAMAEGGNDHLGHQI
ncbi:MAG TPA: SRPBCC family protein [Tepidisphaeraceae bacterium]|nr:SRPBCC family protein [Tepidisphaeraceae bacterium]